MGNRENLKMKGGEIEMRSKAILDGLKKEPDIPRDLVEIVKQSAHTFEQEIFRSARAGEDDKSRLTAYAVENLVRSLRNIDLEIGNNKDLAENLRKVFRLELQTLCSRGPLWNHALIKPRGYPGDFEILSAIYRNTPITRDPVGYELDRAFLTSPLAEAVRNRKDAVVTYLFTKIQFMEKENVRILNLACGPCVDVADLLDTDLASHLSILCIDQDKEALDFAKSIIGQRASNHNISYLQANALRARIPTNLEIAAPFDIIYSVGLLDYIPDRLLSIALRNWWQMLGPGGSLLLTIKDKDKYDSTFYDWMADWTFISRTEKQFTALLSETLKISENKLDFKRDKTEIVIIASVIKEG